MIKRQFEEGIDLLGQEIQCLFHRLDVGGTQFNHINDRVGTRATTRMLLIELENPLDLRFERVVFRRAQQRTENPWIVVGITGEQAFRGRLELRQS